MRSAGRRRSTGLALAGLVLAGLLIWSFLQGRREAAQEAEYDRAIQAPDRVSRRNGDIVVTLDPTAQARADLRVAGLGRSGGTREIRAYGAVVPTGALAELYGNYRSARAESDRAQASLFAARRTQERLMRVLAEGREVNSPDIAASRGRVRLEESRAAAALAASQALGARTTEEWGPEIGRWVAEGSPRLTRFLSGEDVLIRITLPAGIFLETPPRAAAVLAGPGSRVQANLLSGATRVDPQLQGQSFFYVAPRTPGLIPGMSVAALLPAGVNKEGAVIPESAILWWQGKAWAYIQTAPRTFVRREVPTDTPADGIGFIAPGFPEDARLVVRGAEVLFSEEFRGQIRVGEDEEKR